MNHHEAERLIQGQSLPFARRDESFIKRYQPLEMLSAIRKKG